MLLTSNPLLTHSALFPFNDVDIAFIKPAVKTLLSRAKASLENACSEITAPSYDSIEKTLAEDINQLEYVWRVIEHLVSVRNTPELREVHGDLIAEVSQFFSQYAGSDILYSKYKVASKEAINLTSEQNQVISNILRDAVLSGAELTGEQKKRFNEIQTRLDALSLTFSNNVMDATDAYSYLATSEELIGVPENVLIATRAAADNRKKTGHLITLQMPVFLPIMLYAENRSLRERLHRAYVTRCSDLESTQRDNSMLMQEIIRLRQEKALLLGYQSFAEVSLAPKMAESPQEVIDFLQDLSRRVMPFAKNEYVAMKQFASEALGIDELEVWDHGFVSQKLKKSLFSYSSQDLRPYLQLPTILTGIFNLIDRLFDVKVVKDLAPIWHDTVEFFRVERDGQVIGYFYTDLFARTGKQPGAWMNPVNNRWHRFDDRLQLPTVYLVCNFASPQGDSPALLNHDELITLFHEFGHGLHTLLTKVDERLVAGTNGVEWDAIELPSQFMENFCWEWDILTLLTRHVDTGESIPLALFNRMQASRHFQSGLQMMRQVEMALFDMRLHNEVGSEQRISALLDEIRSAHSAFSVPDFNRFQNCFSHIFSGGYAAGYYSYRWAELLSADSWSAFEEEGILNPETGKRYLREILEKGGSRPAIENFIAFRGRKPTIDAMLRHQGLVKLN